MSNDCHSVRQQPNSKVKLNTYYDTSTQGYLSIAPVTMFTLLFTTTILLAVYLVMNAQLGKPLAEKWL